MGGISAGINLLGQREVIILLTSSLFGLTAAGLVLFAIRTVNGAMGAISVAVAHYFTKEIGKSSSPKELRRLFWGSAPFLLIISLAILGPFALVGPAVYSEIFGPEWSEAGTYARVLLPIFVCQFVISPFSAVMLARGKHGSLIVWDVVRVFAAAVWGLVVWYTGIGSYAFVGGVSLIYSGMYLILLWIALRGGE